jgi:hypothetical protein
MSRSSIRFIGGAALAALLLWTAPASADPDLDGSVKALAAVPADATGDFFGGAGMVLTSLVGLTGDAVAVVDNNEYSRIVLRGLLSTPIRRLALGLSQMSTGTLEGFGNVDHERYPQDESTYLKVDLQNRVWTFRAGLGAVVLTAVDVAGGFGQFLLRAPGATATADSIARFQTDTRTSLVGPHKAGAYEVGVISLGSKK